MYLHSVSKCLLLSATVAASALGLTNRAGAYTFAGSQWPQPGGKTTPVTLTYSYQNMFNGGLLMPNNQALPKLLIRNSIEEALGLWASVTPLHFVEVVDDGLAYGQSSAHGQIRFRHIPINGIDPPPPANPIAKARAYYPSGSFLGGDVEYDNADRWQEVGTTPQPDILGATVHELGHAIGLGHSASDAANMYWIFNRFSGLGTASLDQDDIDGIRILYGAGTGSVTPLAGSWQDRPIMPASAQGNQFEFTNVPSGRWVDPPIASELRFTATNGTLVSSIADFPAGFETALTLSVNGDVLGQFTAGQSFNFQAFPGGGVNQFVISGIDPLANTENPLGFPLKLAFTTPTGSFTISAVPEPATLWLLFSAMLVLIGIRRRASFLGRHH